MNSVFMISGVLGLVVLASLTLSIQSQRGMKDIQPSIKSIILFWKEEEGIKRTIAFFNFFFLHLLIIGAICSLIGFDFFDLDLLGFTLGIAVYSVPLFIYFKTAGSHKKQ